VSGGVAPRIVLRNRRSRVASFTPRLFYPQGKSYRYPLDTDRMDAAAKEKNSQPLPRIEPRSSSP